MQSISKALIIMICLLVVSLAQALESDRLQPLEVNADSTGGMLGDGVTTLSGHVEIRQGSLLIKADRAEVDKADGKVTQIKLLGNTASLQQEIEEQGLVKAWAQIIEYQVGSGVVVLSGAAEVTHPQYEISGEQLRYDLNLQHFEGNSDEDGNGRIHILLTPEVAAQTTEGTPEEGTDDGADDKNEADDDSAL